MRRIKGGLGNAVIMKLKSESILLISCVAEGADTDIVINDTMIHVKPVT
jgi:hypothetical protein